MILVSTIATAIFNRVLDRLLDPNVPVDNTRAREVASKIAQEVAPIVENATNQEPWFRSRIYIGLISAGVGVVLEQFGIHISGPDLQLITSSIPELVQIGGQALEIIGLLYAAYGRAVGAKKKPL